MIFPAPSSFVLGGTVLWGEDLSPQPDCRVLVSGGRIDRLLDPGETVPSGIPSYEFVGATILPGLIDTHCHLTLPGDGRDVDRFLLEATNEELVRLGVRNARDGLLGGVTTFRDLGARGTTGFDVVRALDKAEDPVPRVIASGPVITPPRGHGWTFGVEVQAVEKLQGTVHCLKEQGAGVIKVMASGGSTPGTKTWQPAFGVPELQAVVDAARRCDLPVAAHVSCPQAAAWCLDVGVDDIEHLNLWSDDTYTNRIDPSMLDRVARQGVFVGPTLQTPYRILHMAAEAEDPRAEVRARLYQDVVENFERFVEAELRLIAGSDAGFLVTRFDELHLGLRLMVEHGLSAQRALRTATVEAAAALRLETKVGSLQPGLDADILIVEGDPLRDIKALENVRSVFVRGQEVRLHRQEQLGQPE